jgi:hypothetical protein
MSPAGFEPAIPPSELPQIDASDHAATGIGVINCNLLNSITPLLVEQTAGLDRGNKL